MPYIITTKRHCVMPGSASLAGVTEEEWEERNITRRAVATLHEAWGLAMARVIRACHPDQDAAADGCDQALAITGWGGTVGPLADGTTIEIRFIKWDDLSDGDHDGPRGETWAAEKINAYNAAQGGE